MMRFLNILLFISSLFGYLEWAKDQKYFVYVLEMEIISKFISNFCVLDFESVSLSLINVALLSFAPQAVSTTAPATTAFRPSSGASSSATASSSTRWLKGSSNSSLSTAWTPTTTDRSTKCWLSQASLVLLPTYGAMWWRCGCTC